MRKNSSQTGKLIEVEGTEFRWHVHRQPQWCTADGWKGLALHVEPAHDPQRALIVEFPFAVTSRRSTPQRQRPSVSEKQVAASISAALVAGWEPSSSGKPFIFEFSAHA
jgi:hypothetical protein